MKYRRIKMFWYDHKVGILSYLAVIASALYVALIASADCSVGGPCDYIGSTLADFVLGPKK